MYPFFSVVLYDFKGVRVQRDQIIGFKLPTFYLTGFLGRDIMIAQQSLYHEHSE